MGELSGRWWLSGRLRVQSLDLVKSCNKSCFFVIFARHTSALQCSSDPNDLFNVANVFFIMADGVSDLGNGEDDSTIIFWVVGEGY